MTRFFSSTGPAVRFSRLFKLALAGFTLMSAADALSAPPDPAGPPSLQATAVSVKQELVTKFGGDQKVRIERGVDQAASLWRAQDGTPTAFAAFALGNFIADPALLDATFAHLEYAHEQLDGYFNELNRELRHWSELDQGPILPIDRLFAAFESSAHVTDDLFENKVAFVVLLNFPLTSLQERQDKGAAWSRRQWAEARLAQRYARRIPATVSQAIQQSSSDAEAYIAEYNVWMHHLLDPEGHRLFPSGLRLISHWNLRDDLKARYAEKDGISRQRMIAQVMERIVTQTIPQAVIDNPRVDWSPFENRVRAAPVVEIEASAPTVRQAAPALDPAPSPSDGPEPDTRYARLLATFHAVRQADPHSPLTPTHIARRFEEDRELPEARVRELFAEVLGSPLVPRIARLIEKRLGRKLEPFDVWYNGFQARGRFSEPELDAIVRKKYPDVAAYQADIPRLLADLGFTPEKAAYLSARIVVDPARGAGHAMQASRRGDQPHLRTRVEKGGMNYKGYNIAVHEMGHNVEQVFSLYEVDHTLLQGVPNTAFTEALAFVFQQRDIELLGLSKPDAESERLRVLNDFWMTYEIAGPALVDMAVWHWMYDHPAASPKDLRVATVAIAKDVWNKYYAPVFGVKDVVLLGIYSHMISSMMYLPDYPLGHLIAFQIEEQLQRAKPLGKEFERMASFGRVSPDLWMTHATGSPVSAGPLLRATEKALGPGGR